MTFLYGFLGGLAVVGLLATGGVLGWQMHKAVVRHTSPTVEAPEQEELERMKASQQAFRELSNYSAEVAYGMRGAPAGGDRR